MLLYTTVLFVVVAAAPAPNDLVLDLGAGVKMPLVRIKAGSFMMGSSKEEADQALLDFKNTRKEHYEDEQPKHEVKITKDFLLGKYPVTRAEFERFVAEDGFKTEAEKDGNQSFGYNAEKNELDYDQKYTWRDPGFPQGSRHPVVVVSWNDAHAFCRWLSKKTGKRCDLPTEAQWEYACRAGKTTRYFTGDDPDSLEGYANVADGTLKARGLKGAEKWAYFSFSDGFVFTSPVEAMKPNPWGLHDMTGNVWQWCADWYDAKYYANSPTEDPQGPDNGASRLLRGGAWSYVPRYCRAARRGWNVPTLRYYILGFRISVRLD